MFERIRVEKEMNHQTQGYVGRKSNMGLQPPNEIGIRRWVKEEKELELKV